MAARETSRPRALVTGASSGIGAAFAERLAQDGYDLIVVARRRDRLEDLAGGLAKSYGGLIEVLAADLAEPSGVQTVEGRISNDPGLDMLVNSAGFGGYQSFVELDPDRAEQLIHVQVIAVTRLTRAALPGMLAQGHGAVINVSSRLAFSGLLPSPPLPRRATYAATKAYLNTFSQILQNELEGTGVQVQALCPGLVSTEFHEHVAIDPARLPPHLIMSPQDVVEASLAGLRLGEVICIPPLEDAALLAQVQDSQRELFESSRTGTMASRYRPQAK